VSETSPTPGTSRRRSTLATESASRASTLRSARCFSVAIASTATRRPSRTIPTRSATCSTWSSSCEERKTVRPVAARSRTSSRTSCWRRGSRPLVGSSRIRSSGSCVKAAITPTFCLLPLESSPIGRASGSSKRSASSPIDAAAQAPEIGEEAHRRTTHGRLQLTWEVARQPPHLDALRVGVEAGDLGVPPGRPDQVEEKAYRRGLPGPVRAEVAEDLPPLDPQLEIFDAPRLAVELGQAYHLDRRRAHGAVTVAAARMSRRRVHASGVGTP
jgi:hypothetical protein